MMCDVSIQENKAIKTQLAMKNIQLNQDVINVIKSFIFYDKTIYSKQMKEKMEQKERKDSIIDIIKYPENNQGQHYVGGYYSYECQEKGFGHWSIWLPISTTDGWNDFQMNGSNCLKCGKYVYVSTLELESIILNNKYIVCVNGEH